MGVERLILLMKQWGMLIVVGMVGIAMLVYGLWKALVPEPPRVEIVRGESTNLEQQTIFVDVAGAVEKPGVYQLPSSARVGDVLVSAGGLSASADRAWVSQTLNLAETVKDGGKIYIPSKNENNQQTNIPIGSQGKININTASQSELITLSGVGQARAKAIIDNRPYKSIEELVSKAKIPQSTYDKFKDELTVY